LFLALLAQWRLSEECNVFRESVGSAVAIRVLRELCLGIIFQLGHLRLPTNLVQMASPGPSPHTGGVGALCAR